MKKLIALILAVAMLLAPTVALASDITGARWYSIITISNNSTTTDDIFTTFPLGTQNLIDTNFLSANLTDCAMHDTSRVDTAFMPSVNATYPWCLYASNIGEDAFRNYLLYVGGNADMDGKIRYFPGVGGMTSTDNATLELSDNFTIEQKGWFDTDNGTQKDFVLKPGAFRSYVSETISENITASIYNGDSFDTDLWTDVGTPKILVNVGNSRLEYEAERSAIDERSYRNIGTLSDTEWLIEYTWELTSGGANTIFAFGMWDTLANLAGYGGDAIYVYVENVTVDLRRFDGGGGDNSADITVTYGTTYYLTLQRISSISASLSVYTDAERTTHETGSPVSLVIPATVGDLKYLAGSNYDDNFNPAAEQIGWIDGAIWEFISVSATGVESGEHTITVTTDNTSLFFGIGKDIVNADFPITDNLTFNAPLWHTELDANPFTTKDAVEHSCTVTGAVWSSDGRWFDALDDLIDCGSDASIDNIFDGGGTIETWINPASDGEGDIGRIIGKEVGWWLRVKLEVSGEMELQLTQLFSTTPGQWETDDKVVPINTWTHILMTYDSSDNTSDPVFYINGSLVANTKTSTPAGTRTSDAADNLRIGSNSTTTQTWDGYIGEVRGYNPTFTPEEVQYNYNATRWKYETSDEYFHYNLLSAVPDTTYDWTFVENYSMPYMKYHKIWIDGVLRQHIEYEYNDTVFSDLSGNSQDATPTFRTGSSDADVSATMASFLPIEEAKAPAWVLETEREFWDTGNITAAGTFTTTPTPTAAPGIAVIEAIAAASGTPSQLPFTIISGFVILAVSLTFTWFMAKHGSRNLWVKSAVIAILMAFCVAVRIYDFWMVLFFIFMAIAVTLFSRQRSVG